MVGAILFSFGPVAVWASLFLLGSFGFLYRFIQVVQTICIGEETFDLSTTGAHITVGTFKRGAKWDRQLARALNSLPVSSKCDVKASDVQFENMLIVRFRVTDQNAMFLTRCEQTVASGGSLPKGYLRRSISNPTFFGPLFHLSIWSP